MIYFVVRRWEEEALAKRLAQLFYGNDHAEKREGETRWHIGRANDVWLHPDGERKYKLSCRYLTPEKRKALSVMLEWLLRVEISET